MAASRLRLRALGVELRRCARPPCSAAAFLIRGTKYPALSTEYFVPRGSRRCLILIVLRDFGPSTLSASTGYVARGSSTCDIELESEWLEPSSQAADLSPAIPRTRNVEFQQNIFRIRLFVDQGSPPFLHSRPPVRDSFFPPNKESLPLVG